ncbi:MAG: hypothetical protein JXA10_05820 [Anaerolineae bacterium]|nr:hypothetical protein [Anaerolineae bacterium]
MTDQATQRPAFKGLKWHREPYFSFFIPLDWTVFEWEDDRQGVLYGPSADDDQTVFAVDVKEFDFTVTADDLDDVYDGFITSIQQLPDVSIESSNKRVAGKMVALEAKYTFTANDTTRKRWVRVLYYGPCQVAFTAQGATPETYDYWLPMFFEAMMTAKVHASIPKDA